MNFLSSPLYIPSDDIFVDPMLISSTQDTGNLSASASVLPASVSAAPAPPVVPPGGKTRLLSTSELFDFEAALSVPVQQQLDYTAVFRTVDGVAGAKSASGRVPSLGYPLCNPLQALCHQHRHAAAGWLHTLPPPAPGIHSDQLVHICDLYDFAADEPCATVPQLTSSPASVPRTPTPDRTSKTPTNSPRLDGPVLAIKNPLNPFVDEVAKVRITTGPITRSMAKEAIPSRPDQAYLARPNVCKHCQKRFTTPQQLRRHVDCVHLKIKPHKCRQCKRRFRRSDHLKTHIAKVHRADR